MMDDDSWYDCARPSITYRGKELVNIEDLSYEDAAEVMSFASSKYELLEDHICFVALHYILTHYDTRCLYAKPEVYENFPFMENGIMYAVNFQEKKATRVPFESVQHWKKYHDTLYRTLGKYFRYDCCAQYDDEMDFLMAQ